MARITVEDCLEVVDNRFELVMLAARRARQLANGVEPQLDHLRHALFLLEGISPYPRGSGWLLCFGLLGGATREGLFQQAHHA